MIIFKKAVELAKYLENQTVTNKNIGFVPTMGALHIGHISLVNASKKQCKITVVSIFVNPTQFNNKEDLAKYPQPIDKDIALLEAANCDVLYLPSVAEMYPNGIEKIVHYNIAPLDTTLEGEFRPGHFQGVCNVVHTLLLQVTPTHLFMGAKDYQQCMVVRQLIAIENLPVNLCIQPTERAATGLALSSRNARLSDTGREKAASIYAALQYIKDNKNNITWEQAKTKAEKIVAAQGLENEYWILANALNLLPLKEFSTTEPMVVVVATWLEGVRLIDNLVIS